MPMKKYKIAALDDYQHVALESADRRWMHGKRPLLRSSRAESMEDPNRSGGQAVWKPLVRGGPAGNSTWQEQTALAVGTSHSHPRRHAAAAGGERTASS